MILEGTIISGHGVASGKGNDTRYPKGTLLLQIPHFQSHGIDISDYYNGTLNVRIPHETVRLIAPKHTAREVAWSPHIQPENFFFFDVEVCFEGHSFKGLIYMPDPATKTDHFQDPSVIELLLPQIPGIKTGKSISLRTEDAQIQFQ